MLEFFSAVKHDVVSLCTRKNLFLLPKMKSFGSARVRILISCQKRSRLIVHLLKSFSVFKKRSRLIVHQCESFLLSNMKTFDCAPVLLSKMKSFVSASVRILFFLSKRKWFDCAPIRIHFLQSKVKSFDCARVRIFPAVKNEVVC